jgi:preprotein translocase subunit YajC
MNQILSYAPLLQASGGAGQLSTTIITFGLVFLIFYFLIIRPQNKKQKEARQMLANLKKGDRVVTIGGIRGTVQAVRDDAVVLKVDDNVKIEFNKAAVAGVLNSAKPEASKQEKLEADEAESESSEKKE